MLRPVTNDLHGSRPDQQGVSLVELMVAMVIALILGAGVISIFIGSNQAYRFTESSSRIQENTRFTVDTLSHELRKAGYRGCRRIPPLNVVLQGGGADMFQPTLGIAGLEAVGTTPGSAIATNYDAAPVSTDSGAWLNSAGLVGANFNAMPGSDILYLWNIGNDPVIIESISPGANTVVRVSPNNSFQDGDIVLLTDCTRADLVQACNVQNTGSGANMLTNLTLNSGAGACQPSNLPGQLNLGTSPGAGEAVQVVGWVYYIGKRADNAANPPGLFRRQVRASGVLGQPEEIAEGVENMQIVYGVDTSNNRRVDEYLTANNVDAWTRVISVQLELLFTSINDNVLDADQTLFFNGADMDGDRRLRKPSTTTVTLRNRAF